MAIFLGLAAALTYGAADFFGGVATKRSYVSRSRQAGPAEFSVVVGSQVIGSALLLLSLPFFLDAPFTSDSFFWGMGAGAGGGLGVLLLYRGLALGRMSVVAPTTGVVAAGVPVVVGLTLGERPGPVPLAGVALALVAVALVSNSPNHGDEQDSYSGIREALGAGVAFGAFFIFLSLAGDADSGLWPLVGARIASLGIVALIAVVGRRTLRPARGALGLMAAAGILDVSANLLYLLASRVGLLSLVAVLTSMYPGATVLLARVVLHERLHRLQLAGLACAALGVALIAAG